MIRVRLKNSSAVRDHFERVCLDSKISTKGLISIISKRTDEKIAAGEFSQAFFLGSLLLDLDINSPENLITGGPEYLKSKIDFYQSEPYKDALTPEFKEFLLKKVFFYGSYEKWNAYQLAQDVGTGVCPYCNRQFINTISGHRVGNTRPQFDHFFDKANYPYLSMSFYNLVPSCGICNSGLKGSNEFNLDTHIHPYLADFNGLSFSVRPKDIGFLNGKPSAYRIRYRNTGKLSEWDVKKCMRNISVFRITELYQFHKDYTNELILKARIYNKSYAEALFKQFEGTLFSDVNDVRRLIASNYLDESDFDKRPLAKLGSDIITELGLFN